ncbi:MAG: RluA family pseudouridine synthase [Moraxellaceae bacterium]
MEVSQKFIRFKSVTDGIDLPQAFTFPFYYQPHPLSLLAANELQDYLENQFDANHNFGLNEEQEGLVIGKMFGVLVVKNQANELGYLAAFSGKLANENHHDLFVEPVFDILDESGFYKREEEVVNEVNATIEALENNADYLAIQAAIVALKDEETQVIATQKAAMKEAKKIRDEHRKEYAYFVNETTKQTLLDQLNSESVKEKFLLKDMVKHFQYRSLELQEKYAVFQNEIDALKEKRKVLSNQLQQQIFENYFFLNALGEQKSLGAIFENTADMKPIAGSGECAAPKLLQHAYNNNLTPICLAEFWWGQAPKSEIRLHKQFYPACKSKCEPILGHMLEGLTVDPNPMLENPAEGKTLAIVYEDDELAVINKPAEFLSVPGKNIYDSVYARVQERYPNATGPLIVHRLDMSTSGLLIVAKNKTAHQQLQRQFIKRNVKKRYVALLDGIIQEDEGVIDLPLRVDLDDRPRQLVCYEHGKNAVTHWKVIKRTDTQTLIHFYPITGRTHQLRVHAAHSLGLNAPIVGDDLYGTKADRLHLHAEWIQVNHPVTHKKIQFQVDPDFHL